MRSSPFASSRNAITIEAAWRSSCTFDTNDRSIFSTRTGMWRRRDNDE